MQSIGSGTSVHTVSAGIAGLTPSSIYHYRLTATNANGSGAGNDMTLVTPALLAPAVTTGTAAYLTGTTAVLLGTVNPNGPATQAQFQYGLDTTYGNLTPMQSIASGTSPHTVYASVAGLTPSTIYHFRLTATNANGSGAGNDMTFVTPAITTPVVTTGSASNIGPASATISGSVNPDGSATGAFFQYGMTTSYGMTTPAQSVGSGTSAVPLLANISGLKAGTIYHYQLAAISPAGRGYGADMTFQTLTTPTVSTRAASNVTPVAATLNGLVNPNGSATTVVFEYGLDTTYGSQTNSVVIGSGAASLYAAAAISSLVSGTTYHIRIDAANVSGTTYGNDITFATPVPPPPMVITYPATATGTTGATLNAIFNPEGTPTSVSFQYGLDTTYGSTIAASSVPGGSNTGTQHVSAQLTNLQPATTYHFRAVADGAGIVSGSDRAFTTLFPFGTYAGRYGALLLGASNSGLTIISLTTQGTYTASVRLGNASYSFGGRISQTGTTYGTTRGLELYLEMSATTGAPQVTGSLDGVAQLSFTAEPLFTGTLPAAAYTAYMAPPADPTLPQGIGYGRLTASTAGSIYLVGQLGDNHAFAASGALLMDGTTGILYGTGGGTNSTANDATIETVMGNVLFTSSSGAVNAALAWVKPQTTGTYTPEFIATTVNLVGSAYAAPASGPMITSTTGNVEFANGNLATSPLDIPVTLSSANKIVLSSTASDGLTITITPSSGLFRGSFYDPATHALRSFQGALLQGNLEFGAGVFEGGTEAGSVTIFPQP